MDGMVKVHTDTFCQYPANEGAIARTGFVDFVTSDNPHCGNCAHSCFDIDLRAYVCRRFSIEVHEQSVCDDWLHERTHANALRVRFERAKLHVGCNCMKLEIKCRKSKICNKINDLFAYVEKM